MENAIEKICYDNLLRFFKARLHSPMPDEIDAKNVGASSHKGKIIASVKKSIKRLDLEPQTVGMMKVQKANETMELASTMPDPVSLYDALWMSGETCILFAKPGVGKSIYAVQIASEIAQKEPVIYFDFELTEKQFQMRYTDKETHYLHKFPDKLYRVSIDPTKIPEIDFDKAIMTNIEAMAVQVKAKVLIIDNLTWLCKDQSDGNLAGVLMKGLTMLKQKYGWSMLILAHTKKLDNVQPITLESMLGSIKIQSFIDSSFAIGVSSKDPQLRYIKQTKVRSEKTVYDADNVMLCEIEKDKDGFIHFKRIGFDEERNHLKQFRKQQKATVESDVMELYQEGMSYRKIASKLGISKGKVEYLIKKSNE